MNHRIPFQNPAPPFYFCLVVQNEGETWEGFYPGTNRVGTNWDSEWGDYSQEMKGNRDATLAQEPIFLKRIPNIQDKPVFYTRPDDPLGWVFTGWDDHAVWLYNPRVTIIKGFTLYPNDPDGYNTKIAIGIRECSEKHRPWDNVTVTLDITIEWSYQVSYDPPEFESGTLNIPDFNFTMHADDFKTEPRKLPLDGSSTPGYFYPYRNEYWYEIDGPPAPTFAQDNVSVQGVINKIVSVNPASPFVPPEQP
jgi:hypothetical protein